MLANLASSSETELELAISEIPKQQQENDQPVVGNAMINNRIRLFRKGIAFHTPMYNVDGLSRSSTGLVLTGGFFKLGC